MGKTIVRLGFAVALMAVFAAAQASPHITTVEPATGKAGASCTVKGENLGKDKVAGVMLSDDQQDYPAEVVQETADSITMKVPQVKPGGYNISLRIGNGIYIQPIRFTVE